MTEKGPWPFPGKRVRRLRGLILGKSPQVSSPLSREAFRKKRIGFERNLALMIRSLCNYYDLRPMLLPMHHFVMGGTYLVANGLLDAVPSPPRVGQEPLEGDHPGGNAFVH